MIFFYQFETCQELHDGRWHVAMTMKTDNSWFPVDGNWEDTQHDNRQVPILNFQGLIGEPRRVKT